MMSHPYHPAPALIRLVTAVVLAGRTASLLLTLVSLEAASLAAAQAPILQTRGEEEPITPISAAPIQDLRRVALGELLFRDPRLSHDNTRSCFSCHNTTTNGASANAHDLTPDGRPLALNTPTVFNAVLNLRLNWEGNIRSLEREVEETLGKPATMASSVDEVVSKLRVDYEVVKLFRDAYGSEPNVATFLDAIVTYERSLVTPACRFDRWLLGDAGAITPEELSGYTLFKSLGCISCHQGVNVGETSSSGMASSIQLAPQSPNWSASQVYVTWQSRRPISTMAARPRCPKRSKRWASPSSTAC